MWREQVKYDVLIYNKKILNVNMYLILLLMNLVLWSTKNSHF